MIDLSHFLDIRFLLFAVSNFLLYTWYDVPYVYLADNARELGFSQTEASYLISAVGKFSEIIYIAVILVRTHTDLKYRFQVY